MVPVLDHAVPQLHPQFRLLLRGHRFPPLLDAGERGARDGVGRGVPPLLDATRLRRSRDRESRGTEEGFGVEGRARKGPRGTAHDSLLHVGGAGPAQGRTIDTSGPDRAARRKPFQ